MRKCINCGNENGDDRKFCNACGCPLPVIPTAQPLDTAPAEEMPVLEQTAQPGFTQPTQNEPTGAYTQPLQSQPVNAYAQPMQGQPFNAYGQQPQNQPFNAYGQPTQPVQPVQPQKLCGTDINTVVGFVTKNQQNFLPKFFKFEQQGKSASWNWPVFLFGLLLGMPFIWFYYRKMYKQANILLAIQTAIVGIAYTVMALTMGPMFSTLIKIGEASAIKGYEPSGSDMASLMTGMMTYFLVAFAIWLCNLAIILVTSILANKWYYTHTCKKIAKAASTEDPSAAAAIMAKSSGTAAGIACAIAIPYGIIVSIIVPQVIMILMLQPMLEQVYSSMYF